MKVVLTLSEVLDSCSNWENFCDEQGWDYYAVNEGGGDIQIDLSIKDACKYGILPEAISKILE